MYKIVTVVDKKRTAIDRLAEGARVYHDNLENVIVDVHPKRPSSDQLKRFEENLDADVFDWQYFKTAQMLRKLYPQIQKTPSTLTHHNPYSITDSDWNDYDMVIANNETIFKRLGSITQTRLELVHNATDPHFWEFTNEYDPAGPVIMVANRIESKKGILPVAIACGELGIKMVLVGNVSDPEYAEAVRATGIVDFYENIPDEQLRELYRASSLHVCNSVDNFESGTMPILEAMQSGIPVLTRRIGHVPELDNGKNLFIGEYDPEDVIAIRDKIKSVLSNKDKLESIRSSAWNTARNWNHERRAYKYQRLWRQLRTDETPVSIVVPIYDKANVIKKCFEHIANQTYSNIELVVVDDNPDSNRKLVEDFRLQAKFPVRYIHAAQKDNDYGLARARNLGIIESTGDILVFCDQRQHMEPEAVAEFVKHLKPRYWLYGNKGVKKDFVENFSCVFRSDCIQAGMFSERMQWYGGMSQEIRSRIRSQRITTEFIESAKAKATKSRSRWTKKQEIIRAKNKLWKMGLN